eukprot:16060370-Heterocapsa_arctica.AAC.1
MIGDFDTMTDNNSSPHVRACLTTLKNLGAIFDADCSGKNSVLTPTDVIREAWPRMLATTTPVRTGSVDSHADHAWEVA